MLPHMMRNLGFELSGSRINWKCISVGVLIKQWHDLTTLESSLLPTCEPVCPLLLDKGRVGLWRETEWPILLFGGD